MDHARESKHGEAAILKLLQLQFLIGAELERVKANVAGLAGGVLEPAHTGNCQASLSYANAVQRISHVHHGVFPLVEVDLRPRNGGDDLEQDTGVDSRAGSDRVRVVARDAGNREELLRDHAHRGPDKNNAHIGMTKEAMYFEGSFHVRMKSHIIQRRPCFSSASRSHLMSMKSAR